MFIFSIFSVFLGVIFPVELAHSEAQKEVTVAVVYDESGGEANAVEGVFSYNATAVRPVNVSRENELVSLWVNAPSSSVRSADGTIEFSGMNPGGFGVQLTPTVGDLSQGTLFEIHFEILSGQDFQFSLSGLKLLANDGLGTALDTHRLHFVVLESDESTRALRAPESFTPVLSRDPDFFDGHWFVSFSTVDVDGAVDHFEVKHGWGAYHIAESPYPLSLLDLFLPMRVKAVDSDGLETIVSVPGLPRLLLFLPFLIFFGLFLARLLLRKHVALLGIVFLLFQPVSVLAATQYVWPVEDHFNSSFSVAVRATSSDQALNAVSGVLTYPNDLLKVTSVSTKGSIVDLWPSNPSIQSGQILFSGVVLNPGFTGTGGLIMTVYFTPLKSGEAHLAFNDARVLANDGLGTDILTATGSGTYSISLGSHSVSPNTSAPESSLESAQTQDLSSGSTPLKDGLIASEAHDQFPFAYIILAGVLWVIVLCVLRRLPYRISLVRVQTPVAELYRPSERLFERAFYVLRKTVDRHAVEQSLDQKSLHAEIEKLERHVHDSLEKLKK